MGGGTTPAPVENGMGKKDQRWVPAIDLLNCSRCKYSGIPAYSSFNKGTREDDISRTLAPWHYTANASSPTNLMVRSRSFAVADVVGAAVELEVLQRRPVAPEGCCWVHDRRRRQRVAAAQRGWLRQIRWERSRWVEPKTLRESLDVMAR